MKFENFQEAYLHNMKNVYLTPEFINEPRGNKSKEVLNLSFVIENPIERVCYLPSRKTNIVFNFAEALWYLSGKNDLDFIEYYASNMRKYSMDGKCLTGTAYGKKIFQYGDKKINQWNRLLDVFKEDRDSKRGFIGIFDPNEILTLENIDVSCTIGLQFFIRNSKLFMSTFMRANDAYRGILSDVFSFTFIQEMLATQMGLEVGSYCHNVATTHISDSIDCIITCFVFINNSDYDKIQFIFKEFERVLRKGGKLIVLDSHPEAAGVAFSTFTNGKEDKNYEIGENKTQSLKIQGHPNLVLHDWYWSKSCYMDWIKNANLQVQITHEYTVQNLPSAIFEKCISQYKDYNWGKEWDKAPFIIIVATKESEVSL